MRGLVASSRDGKVLNCLNSAAVAGALLLPGGSRVLSWSQDNTLRPWDVGSGDRRPFEGHTGPLRGALLLPDGRRVLSWSDDGALRLSDLESGDDILPLEGHAHRVVS